MAKITKKGTSFLKKGKSAQQAFETHQKEVEARQAQADNVPRFWMEKGAEGLITFVDGDLGDNGVLDFVAYNEHSIKIGDRWGNHFVCLKDVDEPCPICAAGHPVAFQGVFTVIDHREFESKKTGEVYKDKRKLFVAKTTTLQTLQHHASEIGGLRGKTFKVVRGTKQQSPRVGDTFIYKQETPPAKLKKLYGEDAMPFDYEEAIKFRDAEELAKYGFTLDMVGNEAGDVDPDDIPF